MKDVSQLKYPKALKNIYGDHKRIITRKFLFLIREKQDANTHHNFSQGGCILQADL